jgi:hypothetical protein
MLLLAAHEYKPARSLLLPPLRGVSRRDDNSLGCRNSGSFLEAQRGMTGWALGARLPHPFGTIIRSFSGAIENSTGVIVSGSPSA